MTSATKSTQTNPAVIVEQTFHVNKVCDEGDTDEKEGLLRSIKALPQSCRIFKAPPLPTGLKLSSFLFTHLATAPLPRLIILSNWKPSSESSLFFCVIGNQADAFPSSLLLASSHIVDSHYTAEHLLIGRCEPQWREYRTNQKFLHAFLGEFKTHDPSDTGMNNNPFLA